MYSFIVHVIITTELNEKGKWIYQTCTFENGTGLEAQKTGWTNITLKYEKKKLLHDTEDDIFDNEYHSFLSIILD